jgi:hypothetical protein
MFQRAVLKLADRCRARALARKVPRENARLLPYNGSWLAKVGLIRKWVFDPNTTKVLSIIEVLGINHSAAGRPCGFHNRSIPI